MTIFQYYQFVNVTSRTHENFAEKGQWGHLIN